MTKSEAKRAPKKDEKPIVLGEAPLPFATVHTKALHTGIDWDARVVDTASLTKTMPTQTGLHSASIDAPYALTLANGGANVTLPIQLSINAAGFDHPAGNLLDHVRSRNNAMRGKLSEDQFTRLSRDLDGLADRSPDYIDPSQGQVFFVAGDDEILVTPHVAAKMHGELTRRLNEMEAAWRALPKENRPRWRQCVPLYLRLPIGGDKPQNAGSIANTPSLSTDNRSIRALFIEPPQRRRDPMRQLVAKIAASAKVWRGISLAGDDELLLRYGNRSTIDIDISSHRDADADDAAAIARSVGVQLTQIRDYIARGKKLSASPAFDRLPRFHRAVLDPRCGAFDAFLAAEEAARDIERRIAALMPKRLRADGSPIAFTLSLRSFNALRAALETEFICI